MTIASGDSLHLESFYRSLTSVDRFAAETFHDLHEEVMATATRGHGLMVHVQQLEADFPTIEAALLLQTNHSSFFSNSGCNRVFGTTSSCRSICAGCAQQTRSRIVLLRRRRGGLKIEKKGSWESEYDVQGKLRFQLQKCSFVSM
uniref:uncharacterized protein LOC101309145 isoform X2 n=1 Tax=Fragaria vesca subsp. vesca TaxID=101020 RepID=UPI0005CAC5D5|nr:PREDICTED: uncharacterized protein LOC101309145 isoform X2 [Fragaria vesca subsp. vesca]